MNKFTFADQVEYARLALCLLELEGENVDSLEVVCAFGKLVDSYSTKDNRTAHLAVEYVSDRIRLLKGKSPIPGNNELRKSLEESIAFIGEKYSMHTDQT